MTHSGELAINDSVINRFTTYHSCDDDVPAGFSEPVSVDNNNNNMSY